MVFFRTLIEILFNILFFRIYSIDLIMSEKYLCVHPPCNNVVSCYIDQPKQKTFIIIFMLAASFFTIILGIIEFSSIGIGNLTNAFKNRHKDITKEYNRALLKIYNDHINNWIYSCYSSANKDYFNFWFCIRSTAVSLWFLLLNWSLSALKIIHYQSWPLVTYK